MALRRTLMIAVLCDFLLLPVASNSRAWRAGLSSGDLVRAYAPKIASDKCTHICWDNTAFDSIESYNTVGIELKKTSPMGPVAQRRMRYLSRWKKRYTVDGIRISNSVKQSPTFNRAILDWEERHGQDFNELSGPEYVQVDQSSQSSRKRQFEPLGETETKRSRYEEPEPEETPDFEYEDCLPDHAECMPDQGDMPGIRETPIEIIDDDIEPLRRIEKQFDANVAKEETPVLLPDMVRVTKHTFMEHYSTAHLTHLVKLDLHPLADVVRCAGRNS